MQRRFALIKHDHSLSDLSDFSISGVADNDLLQYNSGTALWENVTVAALNAQLDHGTLTGLADDDHPQYAHRTQNESITGLWSFEGGYYQIINAAGTAENWYEAGLAALDEKWWGLAAYTGGLFRLVFCQDSGASVKTALEYNRVGNTIDYVAYGNSTDEPLHKFYGALSWMDGTTERIQIDQRDPIYPYMYFNAEGEAAYPELQLRVYETTGTTFGGGFNLFAARGSKASPTTVATGDTLGEHMFGGRGSSADVWCMGIRGIVTSVSGNAITGYMTMMAATTFAGLTDRLKIWTNGDVELGVDSPLIYDEHTSAAATPSAGKVATYAKADGYLYTKSDTGREIRATNRDIADEIMLDTPALYWKLNDTSLWQDSSGNGRHATSSASVTAQSRAFIPGDPESLFLEITAAAGYVKRDDFTSPPLTGNWTVEACVLPLDMSTNNLRFVVLAGVGETEVTNYQLYLGATTNGQVTMFWEYGAGTNQTLESGYYIQQGIPYHIAAVKDGTANTVTFYINGVQVAAIAYSNEPSGGTDASVDFCVGYDGTGNTGLHAIGHVAYYSSALTEQRIMAHAAAAGFTTPFRTFPFDAAVWYQNAQSSAYVPVITDSGKMINISTGGVTIPANTSVAFPVGTEILIYNNSASNQTIAITTDTLRLVGTATTGSRTLAQRGLMRLLKVASTEWVASGNGVT